MTAARRPDVQLLERFRQIQTRVGHQHMRHWELREGLPRVGLGNEEATTTEIATPLLIERLDKGRHEVLRIVLILDRENQLLLLTLENSFQRPTAPFSAN